VSFVLPIVPVHVGAVGVTAVPPLVTRTCAEMADPAFGFDGESLTALADTEGLTTTVTDEELFDESGSDVDASMISALSRYVPGVSATMSQSQPMPDLCVFSQSSA